MAHGKHVSTVIRDLFGTDAGPSDVTVMVVVGGTAGKDGGDRYYTTFAQDRPTGRILGAVSAVTGTVIPTDASTLFVTAAQGRRDASTMASYGMSVMPHRDRTGGAQYDGAASLIAEHLPKLARLDAARPKAERKGPEHWNALAKAFRTFYSIER